MTLFNMILILFVELNYAEKYFLNLIKIIYIYTDYDHYCLAAKRMFESLNRIGLLNRIVHLHLVCF